MNGTIPRVRGPSAGNARHTNPNSTFSATYTTPIGHLEAVGQNHIATSFRRRE